MEKAVLTSLCILHPQLMHEKCDEPPEESASNSDVQGEECCAFVSGLPTKHDHVKGASFTEEQRAIPLSEGERGTKDWVPRPVNPHAREEVVTVVKGIVIRHGNCGLRHKFFGR
jgi:hypothetical protein